ncbi:alpha/beta hydrolase [Streptomyces canus]|uniref:alpha/beta hydrolase n=1 Tax=Streptomyces canus TaxID=58343 RepID=UPI000B28F0D0|nr:alpha/beta hydrolase [Streptomyces canus]
MPSDRLDPQIAMLLAARKPADQLDLRTLRETVVAPAVAHPPAHGGAAHDHAVPLASRTLSIRLYPGIHEDCVILFFHGGGFVKGNLDSHDEQARTLCTGTGRSVISVDYRLAPEHTFPSAYDDAVDTVHWAHAHAAALLGHGDHPVRVAVAGTSAGANLGVGAALALAQTREAPVAQLLVCPITSGDPGLPSRAEFAVGYGLTSQAIERFIDAYLAHPAQRHDPRFAPALSPDLAALPPTVLVSAGCDPLRDDARLFVHRLRAEGVRVLAREEPTLPHGFWKYAASSSVAHDAVTRMCDTFRGVLDSITALQ